MILKRIKILFLNGYIFNLINLLSQKKIKEIKIVFFVAVLSSFLESFSIGLLIPLLSLVLGESNQLINQYNENFILNFLSKLFDGKPISFVIILFILFTIFSSIIKIFNQFIIAKFSASVIQEIDQKILQTSIIRPYKDFLYDHSSNSSAAIITKSSAVMVTIKSLLDILIASISTFFIITTLLLFNFKLSIISLFIIGISYVSIGNFCNNKIKIIGKEIASLESRQVKVVQDTYLNTKNILLNQNFNIYNEIFHKIDKKLRVNRSIKNVYAIVSRYFLEAIVVTLASLIILFSLSNDAYNFKIITYLTILFFGMQKLLPYMQIIYNGWINIKVNKNSVKDVLDIINENLAYSNKYLNVKSNKNLFSNFKKISLENISYKYANKSDFVLKNINLEIKRGTYIGIAGGSGAGKSTLLDILLGLQRPDFGFLKVDEKDINKRLFLIKSWQNNISYVSQEVILSSSSILFNICQTFNKNDIDFDKVKNCIELAQLDYLVKKSKDGIFSKIGERGQQLSGGEKQRLAIAKALYKNSGLLIFDEATSSLDPENEKKIINILQEIKINGSNLTIISVAHRYSTLKGCDKIYFLNNSYLKEITFEELINKKNRKK